MCPTNYLSPLGRSALLGDAAASLSFRSLHVLIVDDVASMRRVIGALLRDELRHVRISEAVDGKNALQVLLAADEGGVPVDCVVTDCNMPQMDGITLLKSIREAPALQNLPVLMVTAEAKREVILAAAHAGADGYIVKPFNAATLKDKIEQVLTRRHVQH